LGPAHSGTLSARCSTGAGPTARPKPRPWADSIKRDFGEFISEPKHANAIMAIATVLIFLSGVCYTVFAALQWGANENAAGAAKSAADTAAKQEASWEISQRPWVEVANPSIVQQQTIQPVTPLVAGQPVLQNVTYNFQVTIKTYGNTPALRSYGRMNPRFVNFPSPILPFLKNVIPPPLESCSTTATWEDGTSAYFPTGSYPLLSNDQIASAEDIEQLMHARKALFWIGCVRYEDAFKRRYQTNFCFYWSVTEHPLGWRVCLSGNDLIEYPTEPTTK
jgi:hypothetical protein